MNIGKFELIVLLALVVTMLFVGGKKLPELARGLGQSAKELKKGFREDETEDKKKSDEKSDKK
jgi:sec-independent protein translocase protein TatA